MLKICSKCGKINTEYCNTDIGRSSISNHVCSGFEHSIQSIDTEDTIESELFRLKQQMQRAKDHGIAGNNMVQRIEGDIKRIINSAWLNLFDYSESKERE